MSIEEQRDAIRQTFSKVFVDYEADEKGEMKPVIIRVELRPQSHQTNAA